MIEVGLVCGVMVALRLLAESFPGRRFERLATHGWPFIAVLIGWALYAGPWPLFTPPDLIEDRVRIQGSAAVALVVLLATAGAASTLHWRQHLAHLARASLAVGAFLLIGVVGLWAGLDLGLSTAVAVAAALAAADPTIGARLPSLHATKNQPGFTRPPQRLPAGSLWLIAVASVAVPAAATAGGPFQLDTWLLGDVLLRLLVGGVVGAGVGTGIATLWRNQHGMPERKLVVTIAVGLITYGAVTYANGAALLGVWVAAMTFGQRTREPPTGGSSLLESMMVWAATVWLVSVPPSGGSRG